MDPCPMLQQQPAQNRTRRKVAKMVLVSGRALAKQSGSVFSLGATIAELVQLFTLFPVVRRAVRHLLPAHEHLPHVVLL